MKAISGKGARKMATIRRSMIASPMEKTPRVMIDFKRELVRVVALTRLLTSTLKRPIKSP